MTPDITPELLREARAWIADCEWPDMTPDLAAKLTDEQVKTGIERHYDGGWPGFRADSEPRKQAWLGELLAAHAGHREYFIRDGVMLYTVITCPACGYICWGTVLGYQCPTPGCGAICISDALPHGEVGAALKIWVEALSDLLADNPAPRWIFACSERTNDIARELEVTVTCYLDAVDDCDAALAARYLATYGTLIDAYRRHMTEDRSKASQWRPVSPTA